MGALLEGLLDAAVGRAVLGARVAGAELEGRPGGRAVGAELCPRDGACVLGLSLRVGGLAVGGFPLRFGGVV